jgi:transposase
MKHNVISIDVAKNVFQICALDARNKVVLNKKLTRAKLLPTLAQLQAEVIVMEACYSSNAWGRALQAQGHTVKLIPPWQVKPFVVGNKTDHNDAIAIAEASLRPTVRFVPVKSLPQQDLQSLARIRDRWIKSRTAVINQLRGLLSEYGVCVPKGPAAVQAEVPGILEDAGNGLTTVARAFLRELYDEVLQLQERIRSNEQQSAALLKDNGDYQRLQSISGIGPIIATAVLASVGDAKQFSNGRAMAAWIGLTPKLHGSGDTVILGRISKRGNPELRRLFVHGARTVVRWCHRKEDAFNRWIQKLLTRMHPCKAIVAVANKMARVAWAILSKQRAFDATLAAQ